jgi:hypothetical protein
MLLVELPRELDHETSPFARIEILIRNLEYGLSSLDDQVDFFEKLKNRLNCISNLWVLIGTHTGRQGY